MADKKKKGWIWLPVFLLIVLMAVIIFSGGDDASISGGENITGTIFSPIQGWLYSTTTDIRNYYIDKKIRKNLYREYKDLLDDNFALAEKLIELNEVEKENENLKAMLSFVSPKEEIIAAAANVTGRNPGVWFHTFTIDKGKRDGIEDNMAVVNQYGLVGKVIKTGHNWAKVRTIVDDKSAISAIIERTRDQGTIQGMNDASTEKDEGFVEMIFIPLDSDVREGDRVLTSGHGDIFPKGILIGEIAEIRRDERNFYKTAVIYSKVDFKRLEQVMVLRKPDELYGE